MHTDQQQLKGTAWLIRQIYAGDAFARRDESDDRLFYSTDRFIEHLDSRALSTVEELIGSLVVEKDPVILDLMAGWDSHLPAKLHPSRVVGLGLNENELRRNEALSEHVLHDLNDDPTLPFASEMFDVVLNTVSIDYMTKPLEVFQEVGRILKTGGLFLVIFSNRMFPQKVVKMWWRLKEEERILLVREMFNYSKLFEEPQVIISKGKPRPESDKYAHLGIPSDPVYGVYADKSGAAAAPRPRPPADESPGTNGIVSGH